MGRPSKHKDGTEDTVTIVSFFNGARSTTLHSLQRLRFGVLTGGLLAALSACTLTKPEDSSTAQEPRKGLFAQRREGPPEGTKALSQVKLGNGDIVLEGPSGWCIEPTSLVRGRGSNFASLAGCHALTEGRVGRPTPAGILTVTVSARRLGGDIDTSDALADAVRGQKVLSTQRSDGVALVQLQAKTPATADSIGDPQWRGVFVLGNRVVALAAYGPKGGEIAGSTGGKLLAATAQKMKTLSPIANRGAAMPPAKRLDLGRAIGRLLN